jgi:hypothetical protein
VIVSDAVNSREPIRLALTMGASASTRQMNSYRRSSPSARVEHLERSGFVVMKNHLSSVNELFTPWPKRVAPIRLLGARRGTGETIAVQGAGAASSTRSPCL